MITREEKIQALTDNELRWFLDNGHDLIDDVSRFFSEGGYTQYSEKTINDLYNRLEEGAK